MRYSLVMVGSVALALACAHATGAPAGTGPAAAAPPAAPEGTQGSPERSQVTGSHIRRPAPMCDDLSSGTDALRAYCRDRLDATGRDGNLGQTLQQLDPSITVNPSGR